MYDDLDLHDAVVLVCDDMLAVEVPDIVRPKIDATMRGDSAVVDGLSTSSVSNSSSPRLLDAVLPVGDCGVLRRAGADRSRRAVYPCIISQKLLNKEIDRHENLN